MPVVYLLHFDPPYKHARHYLGTAEDLGPRLYAHAHGKGARLTQVAVQAGCALLLARVWEGEGRALERTLKRRHNAPRECPLCKQEGRP